MAKYIPPDLLEKAKKIDLLTYLKTYYPNEVVKVTNNEYTTKTHDSLRMSNGLWNWCSRGIGGKNAIDYLERVLGYSFPESAEIVLNNLNIRTPIFVENTNKNKIKKLILPEKNGTNNQVRSYLISRGIDEEIIDFCISKNILYEDKTYHNAVFVGYDNNNIPRYAGCRSTNGKLYKNDATGSDKAYSFRIESNKNSDTIYIFEGAIDLLSYATFLKLYDYNWRENTLISLAGVYQPSKILEESKIPLAIENYLKNHTNIKKIVLCLDNDSAGRNASKALSIILKNKFEVYDRPPKFEKDYNDYLCRFLKENKVKNLIKERSR